MPPSFPESSTAFLQALEALQEGPRGGQPLLDWLEDLPGRQALARVPLSETQTPTPRDILDFAADEISGVSNVHPDITALPYLRGTGKRSKIRVGLILALPSDRLGWVTAAKPLRLHPEGVMEAYENVQSIREPEERKTHRPPGKAARRGSLEDRIVIDPVAPMRVELLISSTRSSYAGIELNRLSPRSPSGGNLSFPDWMAFHQINVLHPMEAAARELLEGSYQLACLERALPPEHGCDAGALLKPLPLLHNQTVGNRLVLRKDRTPSGTPARLHIFLYRNRPPELILNESRRRPSALEYRPDDLIAARADRSVRFYLRDTGAGPLVTPTLQSLDPAMMTKIDGAYEKAQSAYQNLTQQ